MWEANRNIAERRIVRSVTGNQCRLNRPFDLFAKLIHFEA